MLTILNVLLLGFLPLLPALVGYWNFINAYIAKFLQKELFLINQLLHLSFTLKYYVWETRLCPFQFIPSFSLHQQLSSARLGRLAPKVSNHDFRIGMLVLNESDIYKEYDYVIIILIQGICPMTVKGIIFYVESGSGLLLFIVVTLATGVGSLAQHQWLGYYAHIPGLSRGGRLLIMWRVVRVMWTFHEMIK